MQRPLEARRQAWSVSLVAFCWLALLVGGAEAREVLPGLTRPGGAPPQEVPPTTTPPGVAVPKRVRLGAREMVTWMEGRYRVLVARGDVELRHKAKLVTAQRVVVWFDETKSELTGIMALDIYLEGQVRLTEQGSVISSELEYFHLETTGRLVLADADGDIPELPEPLESDFLKRARAAREAEAVVPQAGPPPAFPRYQPSEAARGQLLETPYQAYAINTKGFDVDSWLAEDGRRIFVITGGVDIVRELPATATSPAETMELIADNLVTWVPAGGAEEAGEEQPHTELYAEGNVVLRYRGRVVECDRLFLDMTDERAIILNAVIRSVIRQGQIPLYYRAREVRQLNRNQYIASDTIITTCEFQHPHYWLQASQMSLDESADRRLTRATDITFFVGGLPIWYWPAYSRDLNRDRTVLKLLRLRQSDEFGTEVRTAWDLYDFGLYTNDWSNLALVVDVLTERGLGLGLDFDYRLKGLDSEGYFTSYYIKDDGEDVPGVPLAHDDRGRFEWRHYQQLSPKDTLLAEFTWMSDRGFLDEYFEREAREDKEKETILYYKHQHGLSAWTALGKVRVNNFLTKTEYLPQLTYRVLGYPLGYQLWGDRLTLYSTSQVANVRRRPDDALDLRQPRAWRFDTLTEVDYPVAWNFVHFVPYAAARYSAYSDSPDLLGKRSGDSQSRFASSVGFRSSATFSRVYHVRSRLWDLNDIRHIITPTIDYFNRFTVTTGPTELFQFDEVDAINELQVVSLGLRQRWQTRRLMRGRSPLVSLDRRVVNWLVLDVDLDIFPNDDRDNQGDSFGNLELDLIWRLSDHLTVLSDAELDLDDGFDIDLYNVTVKVDRSPRMSFFVGHRYIRDAGSSAFTIGFDYKVSGKWEVGALWQYDYQADEPLTQRVVLTRRLHRWLLEMAFERDEGEDGGRADTSLSVTLIPQAIPEAKVSFF